MIHLVGDLQGCCDAFERLLADIGFSPSRDQLYVLGDLVNRGPESLRTLERLASFGASAVCLLGNHDLNLLAVDQGVRRVHRSDTLDDILSSPRRRHWIDWLRHQRLAVQAHGWLMVHAGVVPQWDAAQTLALAAEVEQLLQGPSLAGFLPVMHGNAPDRWSASLEGPERWRTIINTLTRLRFCRADGTMDFKLKEGADTAPPGLMPWFDVPGRRSAGTPIAFGHWSTLGELDRPDLLALDTGCVWGGRLSAARIDGGRRELVSVGCAQAQAPL
ncbi:symmetrical bis(5'-nucleosyl)-tetraphosphatase [Leptothrix discophora]|uniref:bis(5'-nucleosyl)-tetraphosphatase (symmetrical) n=1 Tax=Leptothrix discophora TaxID=89 RepID=A0ABT9G223_LEPDI|nr:symmetrical bis(5'-nucleosyl)-tetraphosphatase [Leptothrix discophora]MDP4300503.1 symmetrical bis(5'-nucleosyl)-tetraphosphatase [Leptothrix discophora]